MSFCLMLDVDGVLISGRPDDGQAWSTSLATDLGIDPTRLQTAFFRPYWAQIVTGKLDLADTLAICLPRVGARLSASAFIDYWFTRDSRINPQVMEDIGLLRAKGIRVILATNQEHLRAAHLMDGLGLRQHVDGIVYSAQLGARKPERAFFTAAAAEVGMPPSSLLLVDDTRANITAARAARWRAWLWSRNRRLRDLTDL